MKIHTFVALSVTTIPVPASRNPRYPVDRQIMAIGLLAALSANGRRWRFLRRAVATGAGERDEALLQWLSNNLPAPATLIAWQLDSHVVPALLEMAATAMPIVARDTMTQLAASLRGGVVDLALDHGGAVAPPLAQVAADHGIGMPVMTDERRLSDWSWGEVDRIGADAADEALGLWRLFLRKAHLTGLEAEAATEDWLRRRKRIRAVPEIGPETAIGVRQQGDRKRARLGPREGDLE